MLRDSKENTWFATKAGLTKIGYDNRRTKYFPTDNVNSVSEDMNGTLWVSTDKGVFSCDLNSAMDLSDWIQITERDLQFKPKDLIALKDGSVLVVFPGQGISKYQNGSRTNYNARNSVIYDTNIKSIITRDKENIYFVAGTCIYKYSNGTFTNYMYFNLPTTYGCFLDSNNNNIFITCGSFILILKKDGSYESISTYVHGYLQYFDARSIVVDKDKTIWVGTSNMGIVLFKYANN